MLYFVFLYFLSASVSPLNSDLKWKYLGSVEYDENNVNNIITLPDEYNELHVFGWYGGANGVNGVKHFIKDALVALGEVNQRISVYIDEENNGYYNFNINSTKLTFHGFMWKQSILANALIRVYYR